MPKVKSSVVFKQYNQQQALLLPPSLSELIGEKHLLRVVNEVMESMDIADLMNLYQGGGTTAYVLTRCEDQFITGVSVHQNTNDGVCFKEHLEQSARQAASPGAREGHSDSILSLVPNKTMNYWNSENRGLSEVSPFSYRRKEKPYQQCISERKLSV